MNDYNYKITQYFLEQIGDYKKRFPDIKKDIYFAMKKFDVRTSQFLGNKLYKVRVNSSNLEKGKSGGFRLIILLFRNDNVLVPITLYFKGDKKDISRDEMKAHLLKVYRESGL